MNRWKYLIILLTAILPASCDFADIEPPPYIITRPVFSITARPPVFNYAGITFEFLNKSGKTVNSVSVSFMLFDARTKTSPFTGSNVFNITKPDSVPPNEKKEICISLDWYIHIAPAEPYLIDFFYISEIQYADGSVWQDKNGLFYTGTVK